MAWKLHSRMQGITVLLAVIGILITGFLVIKNVKGNILWGILITWILGIICQFTGLYVPNPELGFYGLLPDFSSGLSIPSLSPILQAGIFRDLLSGVPGGNLCILVCRYV